LEDGLTDAGVWGDDSQVVTLIVRQGRDPDGLGYVTFDVEPTAIPNEFRRLR
jgi:Holliday junction resolvase RusA-like endonuclease